jgi:hypothetical protein
LKSIPFRVPHVLPAVRPSRAGADSHEVPRPFGGFPPTSPVCDDSSLPSRFRSQVLSTSQRFPGRSKLRGLVSCRRPPLGFDPSEPSSSPRSRTLLRAASSLAVLHRLSSLTSLAARPRSSAEPRGPSLPAVGPCGLPAGPDVIAHAVLHSGFRRLARLAARLPGSPPELERRFHRHSRVRAHRSPRRSRPRAPRSGARHHRLRLPRSLLPPAKPYHVAAEATSVAVALLGFRPSRALLRSSLGSSYLANSSVRCGLAPRRRGVRPLAAR